MEASSPGSSQSTQPTEENKPPHGKARPGGAGIDLGGTNSNGPAEFSVGGDDPFMLARFWVRANPTTAVVGAFATGLLLGVLRK